MSKPSVFNVKVDRFSENQTERKIDLVAVEEPLEIRLGFGKKEERVQRAITVTMRTPGNDYELATGLLFNEGIIKSYDDIADIHFCQDTGKQEEAENVVRVELAYEITPNLLPLERNFYTNSSCGVCGKTSIDSLEIRDCAIIPPAKPVLSRATLTSLPEKLRKSQSVFEYTGGLHASALFRPDGDLVIMREDIGRHNALDKLIGAMVFERKIPLYNYLLLVSGRASFELVQKSVVAGIPIMAAVGAPSSLAVDLAERFGITLVGFLKENYFNIYSHPSRVIA
jgi:FdhD protein